MFLIGVGVVLTVAVYSSKIRGPLDFLEDNLVRHSLLMDAIPSVHWVTVFRFAQKFVQASVQLYKPAAPWSRHLGSANESGLLGGFRSDSKISIRHDDSIDNDSIFLYKAYYDPRFAFENSTF